MKRIFIFIIFLSAFSAIFLLSADSAHAGAAVTNQSAYRWRNDNGDQATATYKAAENTAITNVSLSEIIRIRIEAEETAAGNFNYAALLQFSSDATTCTNGTWTTLDTGTTAWRVTDSANFTDGDITTDQLTTSAQGFTDGRMKDTSNLSISTNIKQKNREDEWAIRGDGAANSTTYRFRATNNGTALGSYTNCAQLTTEAGVITTTLGSGTDPSSATIAPGAGVTDIDAFTFQTSAGTDGITQATTTFSTDISAGLAEVQITSDNGSTIYGTSTISSAAQSISLSGLTANTTQTQFKIRVVPKTHSAMPAPPGAAYTATATISNWTGTNTHAGSDSNANALTIDNLSPANVTNASGTAGSALVDLSWTNPGDSDFATTTVLRSTSAVSDVPVEGTSYATGTVIGASTVACVVPSSGSSCTDTGLVNGTPYHYKIFTEDTRVNHSTGVVPTGSPFTPQAAAITISGACVQNDRSTNCADGIDIRVAVGGTLQGQSTTTVSGAWTIFGVTQPSSGAIVTVFASGTAVSARAAAVTKYDGTGNITGLDLAQRHLVIGSADNQTITNANLSSFDNSVSGLADVFFDVDASNNLITDVSGVFTDEVLFIKASNIYQPDSATARNIYTHNLRNAGTITANSNSFRVAGNYHNTGTFTAGSSEIQMSSSSAYIDQGTGILNNFTASSSASLTASSTFNVTTLLVDGTISINSGVIITAEGTITLNGTISGAGNLDITDTSSGPGTSGTLSSVVRYLLQNGDIASSTLDARTYGGLVQILNSSVIARTAFLSTGTYNFNNGLNVLANATVSSTLNAKQSNPTVNISGAAFDFTGTGSGMEEIFSGSGTWSASTSVDFTNGTYNANAGNTLVLNGASQTLTTNSPTSTIVNLTLSPSSGALTLADSFSVSGNLSLGGAGTISAGATTITMTGTSNTIDGGGETLNNLTINPSSAGTITLQNTDLFISGTLNVATGDTLSLSSVLAHTGTTITLDGTISGAGTLIMTDVSSGPGTTGTLSSRVRYDATNADVASSTLDARTYGGLVEIYSNSTAARTLYLSTGTYTFQNGLNILAANTASTTLNAKQSNSTVNISGAALDFTGAGDGSEEIFSGTGTWSASSSVDFTGGVYNANSGNTLALNGVSQTFTTAGNTVDNLTFISATSPTISGSVTANGNVTFVSGMTLTGVTLTMNGASKTLVGGDNTIQNFTVGSGGSVTLSTSNLTVSGTLQVDGTLSINGGRLVTAPGTITLTGTISGAGKFIIPNGSSGPGSSGTLSSTALYDATAGDVASSTIAARTYVGLVEMWSSSTSASTLFLSTGTYNFNGGLNILAQNTASTTLNAKQANPIVNISGAALDFTGTGTGSEIIQSGTGTWSASTSVDFTGGTYTAASGNTLLLNGASQTLTTNGQTFDNLSFTNATAATISGNATTTGNITLASSMTLTSVTITMTGSSKTIAGAGNTLPNLTVASGASVTATSSDFTASGTLLVDGTLTINSGRTVSATATTTLNGTIDGAGTMRFTDASTGPGTTGTLNSKVRYDASSANIPATTFDARTYGGLVEAYASSATAKTLTLPTGTFTLNAGLNVLANGAGNATLDGSVNNPTLNIASGLDYIGTGGGSEVIQFGTGTWTISSGNFDTSGGTTVATAGNTLAFTGSNQTFTAQGNPFHHVTFTGATTPTIFDDFTVNGDLTLAPSTTFSTPLTINMEGASSQLIGAGNTIPNLTLSLTPTVTATSSDFTVSGILIISSGNLIIGSGRAITASNGLTLFGTISGAGKLIYTTTTTAFPTGGTISSILRFDSTNNNQTMGARTYGGLVELYNGGGTNRTVTMAAGTQTLSSNLQLLADSTGNITLDAATNNPTVSITGNATYSGVGGGSEIINGSSTMTVSGNLDISNGTFSAPSSTLNLAGNYTNSGGTFTHNSGTVILNGASAQTISGTLSGSSAFSKLQVNNNSGGESNPSVVISATTTATTFVATTTSSTIRFNASSTYTFTNFTIDGVTSTSRILLRSSASPAKWLLNVAEAGSQSVSYVDVKDSDASGGNEVSAGDGTNVDSGGNSNWAFSITAPSVVSSGADVFEINAASTTISNVTVTSGGGSPGGRITATNNIRFRIPDSFPAVFDSSITSITCAGGDACAKISTTGITYESSTKIAVIDVTTSFASGENVVISGLKFGNFSAVKASTTVHRARVDGPADAVDDATDSQVKTVKGKLVLQAHDNGQPANKFDVSAGTVTDEELFNFRLVPTGENMDMATTTFDVTVVGIGGANIITPALFLDADNDGEVDAGESQLGVTGTVSISGGSGTITLGGTWSLTGASNIILRASISSIDEGDSVTFSLPSVNLVGVKGATTKESITVGQSVSNKNHGKPVKIRGGGSAVGGAPPEVAPQGGGGSGGAGGGEGGAPGGGEEGGGGAGGGSGAPTIFCAIFPNSLFCKLFEIEQPEFLKNLLRRP